jgi:hypothetical protein
MEFLVEYAMLIYHEIYPAGKHIEKVTVSRNLRQGRLQEVGLTQILVDHAPLLPTCHVGLHVDFSSTKLFLGPSPPSVK